MLRGHGDGRHTEWSDSRPVRLFGSYVMFTVVAGLRLCYWKYPRLVVHRLVPWSTGS